MTTVSTPELLDRIIANRGDSENPLLFVEARTHLLDSFVPAIRGADILLSEGFIVGIGIGRDIVPAAAIHAALARLGSIAAVDSAPCTAEPTHSRIDDPSIKEEPRHDDHH